MRLGEIHVFLRTFRRQESHLDAGKQEGCANLKHHIGAIVTCRSINPETDLYPRSHIFLDGCNTGGQTHVRGGTVRCAATASCKLLDLLVEDMNGMAEPNFVAKPVHGFHPLDGSHREVIERVALLIKCLAEVGMETDFILTRQSSRVLEERGRHGEGGAGADYDTGHRPVIWIVVGLDGTLGIFQDEFFILDAVVRRQAPFGFTKGHGATAGMES